MSEQPTTSIPGAHGLFMGGAGTGKTYSLRTFKDVPDVTLFTIFNEPSQSTLGDIPCPKIHYHYIQASNMSWAGMKDLAERINVLDNDSLQKFNVGKGPATARQFQELISNLNDFVCNRCGEHFGDVESWGTDRALAIDGLTGLSRQARALTVGYKPIMTQPDWGVAMQAIEQMVFKLTHDLFCHLFMIAHLDMEKDEITGGTKLYPSTLGRKLPPIIPPMFDDVVRCIRDGTEFYWNTTMSNTDVKGRILPLKEKILPNFAGYLDCWRAKGGKIVSRSQYLPPIK